MISGNDKVIKISFYIPAAPNVDIDDVRQGVLESYGAFNVYCLKVKETTLNQEEKENGRI